MGPVGPRHDGASRWLEWLASVHFHGSISSKHDLPDMNVTARLCTISAISVFNASISQQAFLIYASMIVVVTPELGLRAHAHGFVAFLQIMSNQLEKDRAWLEEYQTQPETGYPT